MIRYPEAVMSLELLIPILAVLCGAGGCVVARHFWSYRSAGEPAERLLVRTGRFKEKEIEILGSPPKLESEIGDDWSDNREPLLQGLPAGDSGASRPDDATGSDKRDFNIAAAMDGVSSAAVSYTHLTLPTKRIV